MVYKTGFDSRLRALQGPRSQTEFASDAKISREQLSRYLDPDGPRPQRRVLERIAKAAYDGPVRPEWLATGEGPMRPDETDTAGREASPNVVPIRLGLPPIIPAEDFEQLRQDVRREYVPILGGTAAGPPSFESDEDYPVGWAEEFVRVPGAMYGQFALRIRGQSMAPDYPDGSLVLVGGAVMPRAGLETLAVVFLLDEKGEFAGHTVKMVVRRDDRVRLRPLNPDYVEQDVPLAQVAKVLGVLKRLA